MIVNPIVVFTPRPPQFGPIVIADFGRFHVLAAQPQAIVIADDSPCRDRAFFVSVELGDNLFRRGRFREAMRHYEFALFLAPGRDDIRIRLDRCRLRHDERQRVRQYRQRYRQCVSDYR